MYYGIDFNHFKLQDNKETRVLIRRLFLHPYINCSKVVEILKKKFESHTLEKLISDLEEGLNRYIKEPKINISQESLDAINGKIHSWSTFFGQLTEVEILEYIDYHELNKEEYFSIIKSYNLEVASNPSAIKEILDQYVIGQEKAKEAICFAFYLHLLRTGIIKPPIIIGDSMENDYARYSLPKPNMMLVGSTGSGKTYIIKTLCNLFDIPFVKIDCASLTSSGYTGKGVDDYLYSLYKNLDQDLEKMEKSIIYFDEIDKLSEHFIGRGSVGGVELQQEFLTLLEDEEIMVEPPSKSTGQNFKLKSSNLMFVFSGSFSGIEKIIENRNKGERKLGFNRSPPPSPEKNSVIAHLTPQDIISFGIIPELVGRINFIESLDPLTVEDIKNIMLFSKDSALERYKNFFKIHLDKLIIMDEVYELIAAQVIESGGGGRAIVSCLQRLLKDVLFKAPNMKREVFIIDKDYFNQIFNSKSHDL
ncbi:MAG: AAA family ATPase [Saprospiraceae bacterium]|nr:AAA family ATPase [Candidatus Vicinibacter affinis]